MDLVFPILQAFPTPTPTPMPPNGSGTSVIPNSTATGVLVSVIAAVSVYSVRQWWEGRKLRRALLTEVEQMDGLEACKDQFERVDEPPSRPIQPDDLPATESIPTVIYQNSSSNIGLLGGPVSREELLSAVEFYSSVGRYKGIIRKINDGAEVSDTDQEDLYDEIEALSDWQAQIVEEDEFVPKPPQKD